MIQLAPESWTGKLSHETLYVAAKSVSAGCVFPFQLVRHLGIAQSIVMPHHHNIAVSFRYVGERLAYDGKALTTRQPFTRLTAYSLARSLVGAVRCAEERAASILPLRRRQKR